MATERIPLVGNMDSSYIASRIANKDQYFQDCIVQPILNSAQRTATYYLKGRETNESFLTSGSGASTSVLAWTGKSSAYAAYARGATNSNIYVYDGATVADLGAIVGQGIHMSEDVISGTPNIIVISASGSGRTWFYPDGGALTEITDTDFPPKQGTPIALTGPAVHINGKMGVMTANPARFYESDINSLASWGINNYLSLQKLPDLGIGAARYKDWFLCFGINSTEVIRDVGNPSGSSFVSDGFFNIGCPNQHAFLSIWDTVAFIGNTGTGESGVYLMEGMTPKKISTPIIDSYIQVALSTGIAFRLFAMQSEGRQYLVLENFSGGTGTCFVYHPEMPVWVYWVLEVLVHKTAPFGPRNLIANATGPIYRNTVTAFSAYTAQTMPMDLGSSNKKIVSRVSLLTDMVPSAGNATVTLRYGDYDSATDVVKTIALASRVPQAYRCGSGKKVAIKVAMPASDGGDASTIRPRLTGVELDYDVCSV